MIIRILFLLCIATSLQAQFWIVNEELGYSYGIGEAPVYAIRYESEAELKKAISAAEERVQQSIEAFEAAAEVEGEVSILRPPDLRLIPDWIKDPQKSATEIADAFRKADIKALAKNNGLDHSGKELDVIQRLIDLIR